MPRVSRFLICGALLLGLSLNHMRRFKSGYDYCAEEAKKQEAQHSEVLDAEPVSWLNAYLVFGPNWRGCEDYSKVNREPERRHVKNVLQERFGELSDADVNYLLNHEDEAIRTRTFSILERRSDRRLIPHIAADMAARGKRYGFDKDVKTLQRFRYEKLEGILLNMVRGSYRHNESMLVFGNFSGILSSRYVDPAAEYLIKTGSERALRIFIRSGDREAVYAFAMNNHEKPFIRNYNGETIPLIESAMNHAMNMELDCVFALSYASTIRKLDSRVADAMAGRYVFDCNGRISRAFRGEK